MDLGVENDGIVLSSGSSCEMLINLYRQEETPPGTLYSGEVSLHKPITSETTISGNLFEMGKP